MRISEHIHALKIPFQVTIDPTMVVDRFVYVYLIVGENIALIDTGVAGSAKMIFDYIKSIGRKPAEITNIFLTHSHPDHIGSAKSIKEASRCSVSIHAAEKPWVEDVGRQYRERPVPGFNSLVEGSVTIDRVLEGGETIQLDTALSLEVFHTPGHSKGSASFFLKNDKALFCGDAILLPGQMPIFDDLTKYVDSAKKLAKIVGTELLLSSWDEPQKGKHIYNLMQDSVQYLLNIREAVKVIAATAPSSDPIAFCKQVLDTLELPETMANPLVARSFQSALIS